jgi:antitoxin MazE
MRAVIRKWGNSAAVRIPAAVMEAAELAVNEPVEVREQEGRVVLEPVRRKSYDLRKLIAGINDDNLHEPVDFGQAEGKEVW